METLAKSKSGRVWATRVGDTVELIVGIEPPRKRVSKLTHTVTKDEKQMKHKNEAPFYYIVVKPVTKKVVMEQIAYVGGKVLGYVSYRAFYRKFGLPVERNGLVELSPTYAEVVLKMKWDEVQE